jgi:transcriptional regulator with XRE-family HTH domain
MTRLSKLFEQVKSTPDYKRKAARAAVTADLRILMANAGKSQKEVAEAIGISPAALSAKLSGDKNLTLDSIVDIAGAAGAEIDVVFRAAGTPRTRQMWEDNAQANDMLDQAAILLGEIEAMHARQQVMHAKQHVMQETLESMTRASFRTRRVRMLTTGYHTLAVCANDCSEPIPTAANRL